MSEASLVFSKFFEFSRQKDIVKSSVRILIIFGMKWPKNEIPTLFFAGFPYLLASLWWLWFRDWNCPLVLHLWQRNDFWPTNFGLQLSSRFLTLWSSRSFLQPGGIWQNWFRLLNFLILLCCFLIVIVGHLVVKKMVKHMKWKSKAHTEMSLSNSLVNVSKSLKIQKIQQGLRKFARFALKTSSKKKIIKKSPKYFNTTNDFAKFFWKVFFHPEKNLKRKS